MYCSVLKQMKINILKKIIIYWKKINPWSLFLPSGAPLHQQSAQGPQGPWIEEAAGGQGMKGALGGAGERSPESKDEAVQN